MALAFSSLDMSGWGQQDNDYVSHRACPLCQSDQTRVVEEISSLQFFTDDSTRSKQSQVKQVQCRQCMTLYMNPAYNDQGFETLFSEAGRSYGDGGGRHGEQIEWLQRNGLSDDDFSYMDIGCYEGQFLASLPKGSRFIGVDFDLPAIERAKDKYPGDKYLFLQGRFEEIKLDEKIDVFTMFHVLEHLPDPVGVLQVLRGLAHENTALVVEVPVLELGQTNDIHGFFSPQHLTHFSKHTLQQAFRLAGWNIVETEDASDYNGHRVIGYPCAEGGMEGASFDDYVSLQSVRASLSSALTDVEKQISRFPNAEKIVIWGAGMHLEYILQRTTFFERFKESKFVAVDSDPMKQGKKWRGLSIGVPAELSGLDWDNTCLLVSSYGGQEKIAEAAMEIGVPEHLILKIYSRIRTY